MSFDFNIALTGIGPHSNTKVSSNMSSIQMALYADNGSGKSFISKSFKRISDLKYLDRTDQAQIDLLVEKSTAMVRFGEKQGILSLSIAPDGQPQKNLSVRFEIGSLPIVSDNTGLIYHVFNSEYVRENLEAVRYHPEDKVSGFILGKANIDLSKEKEQLENYKKAELEAIGKVRDMVASTQRELKAKGIQPNTKEYLAITFESVLRGEANSEDQSYTSLVEKYDILKSMPEHMQDISYRPFSDDIEAFIAILENANEIIENKYTLSSFSEEFKKKFKDNQAFIEAGLQLSDGESCPFCGQKYNRDAFALIDDYNSFLQDEESKIIKAINGIIAKITTFSANLLTSSRFAKDSSNEYDKVKEYFPSFCETYISCVDVAATQQVLDKICEALEAKKHMISQKGASIKPNIDIIKAELSNYKRVEIENIGKVKELNSNKNNISAERLRLRKALCNAKFNQLIVESEKTRSDIVTVRESINDLTKAISEKENKVRIDKRKKLIEKLKDYLAIFFKDKYDFDEKQFSVVYQDRALIENTDYVLSDGEKSILAFCFFLANIHGVVENESDYNRLFLVIDDPVSSMDFNYVYNVAQAIRNIKKEPEIGRIRYLVLTHNMEFMSILVRNKIVSKKFLLSDGAISDFKDDYVMPYTANLLDIYKVSIGGMKPIHTIPNQIRHVLETTYRFEGSCGGFDDYILNNEILGKNGCLYSLIEDHSHGGLRTSKGYTDNMLIDSCRMVVDFIASKYPGQIEEVKRLSA